VHARVINCAAKHSLCAESQVPHWRTSQSPTLQNLRQKLLLQGHLSAHHLRITLFCLVGRCKAQTLSYLLVGSVKTPPGTGTTAHIACSPMHLSRNKIWSLQEYAACTDQAAAALAAYRPLLGCSAHVLTVLQGYSQCNPAALLPRP
jgi:hypothetical protein